MTEMICNVCQNNSFYEDFQGAMCCSVCGVQSQDFLATMSDDEDAAIGINEKRHHLTRTASKKQPKSFKTVKESSMFDYLRAYQLCLQRLVSFIPFQDPLYAAKVKELWMKYLKVWEQVGTPMLKQSSSSSSSSSSTINNKSEILQLIRPVKPLLFGFLALAARILRTSIIPADLVRWCSQGLLPYYTLFEWLHDDIKSTLSAKHLNLIRRKKHSITPTNIHFHVNNLAQALDITVPPLNGSLVAMIMSCNLGWPASIWNKYLILCQMYTKQEPIKEFDASSQEYAENIMAQLIVCFKLDKNWEKWKLMRLPKSAIESNRLMIPANLPCLADIPRNMLPQIAQQIRNHVESYLCLHKGSYDEEHLTFNNTIRTFLQANCPSVLLNVSDSPKNLVSVSIDSAVHNNKTSDRESITNIWKNSVTFDDSFNMPGTVLTQRTVYGNYPPTTLRASSIRGTSALEVDTKEVPDTGIHKLCYVHLIERSAQYLRMSPGVLHTIVNNFEKQIEKTMSLLNLTPEQFEDYLNSSDVLEVGNDIQRRETRTEKLKEKSAAITCRSSIEKILLNGDAEKDIANIKQVKLSVLKSKVSTSLRTIKKVSLYGDIEGVYGKLQNCVGPFLHEDRPGEDVIPKLPATIKENVDNFVDDEGANELPKQLSNFSSSVRLRKKRKLFPTMNS